MRRSGFYLTLAMLLGCGTPVEVVDNPVQGEGDQPPSYNFNPGPLPDLRPPPPPEEDGGGNPEDPNLVPSERALFFGQTCPGATKTVTVRLTNTGGDTLTVRGLAVSGSGFDLGTAPSLPARLAPGRTVNVSVSFTAPAASLTPFDGNLRITSNDPRRPTYNIPLSALSLPATVSVSPRQVSFGSVGDGETRTRSVTVTNTSECQGNVHSVRLSGNLSSAVRTGTLPGNIAAGARESFDVRLTCNGQDDNLQATMRLLDRAGRSVGSVQLTGVCTD